MLWELFTSFLENCHACMLFPQLEIFLPTIEPKVIYAVQIVKDLLFLKKLLKFHEFHFIIMILCQASLGDDHIFSRILLLKLNDLPIIRIVPSVHVAKLFRHLSINPKLLHFYFKISMKSWGVKKGFSSVSCSFFRSSILWLSSINEYILDLTFEMIGDRAVTSKLGKITFDSVFYRSKVN